MGQAWQSSRQLGGRGAGGRRTEGGGSHSLQEGVQLAEGERVVQRLQGPDWRDSSTTLDGCRKKKLKMLKYQRRKKELITKSSEHIGFKVY